MITIPDSFTTEHFRFVNYTLLTETESHSVWEARNHPEVRKWMVNAEPISWRNHQLFMKSLATKSDRTYYAVWCDIGETLN